MKKLLIVLLAISCYQFSNAQKIVKHDTIYKAETNSFKSQLPKTDVQTLFPNQKSFGGYFAMTMGYTSIDKKDAFVIGSRLMMVTNHYLGIGFGGKAFIAAPIKSQYEYFDNNNELQVDDLYITLGGGYGGFYIEPVLCSIKPVHVSFPILLGAGVIIKDKYTEHLQQLNEQNNNDNFESVYFLVEPGVDVEFNIAKWFRIGLGTTYRITSNITNLGGDTPNNVLEALSYGMTFKLGWF